MKYKKIILFIVLLNLFSCIGFSQSAHQLLRKGNTNFWEQAYSKAEEYYRKSLAEAESMKANYNLGNAIYQQANSQTSRYEEAVKYYMAAARIAPNGKLKAFAYHNLGNAQLMLAKTQEKQVNDFFSKNPETSMEEVVGTYKKSLESFAQALRHNKEDNETRNNLAFVARKLKSFEQNKNKQNDSQKKDNQDEQNKKDEKDKKEQNKEDKEREKDKENKDEKERENQIDHKENDKKEKGNKDDPDKKEQGGTPSQSLQKQEAERLLQIIDNEEQKAQKKLRHQPSQKNRPEKDW